MFHWLIYTDSTPPSSKRAFKPDVRYEDVAREVRHSIVARCCLRRIASHFLEAYNAGLTAIYWQIASYPAVWLPVSFMVAVVLHDTYFFDGGHRLMHTKLFFKHCHAGHHRSLTRHRAILSFQPLETVFQFGFFALRIVFVPLHPASCSRTLCSMAS